MGEGNSKHMEPMLIIHGGAGMWSAQTKKNRTAEDVHQAIITAAKKGWEKMGDGVLEAVTAAVASMEDNTMFNAGTGSYLNLDGKIEMSASIMDGKKLKAGAVANISKVKNPIVVARAIMDKTDHVGLVGDGALRFALKNGITEYPEENLITDETKEKLKKFKEEKKTSIEDQRAFGDTIGAVAVDRNGNVAYASSTGGRTGQMPGRMSDTSIIGSGGLADNRIGAVTVTGSGETFIRCTLSKSISVLIEQGMTPKEASIQALEAMTSSIGGKGGVIALSAQTGDWAAEFNTEAMAWATIKDGKIMYGVYKGDFFTEDL